MGFPAEPFLYEVSRLVGEIVYYSCSGFAYEETNVWWITPQKLESSLLDVFINGFVRKPNFLPKEFFPGL